jgi:radical SAM superfamily enzyme YgiQ (UPF0313 family)
VENYNVNSILFWDDLFIVDEERIKKIVNLLKKEKIYGKVKFSCQCRANLLNENVAELLKEMGVVVAGIGVESGCQRILRYLKGENVTIKDNVRAIKLLKKYGLGVFGYFIIGSPDETKEEMLETYRFIKNNPLDFVNIQVLIPFPGTPVWEYAQKRGLVSNNMDWDRLSFNFNQNHKKAIILSETLSREEIWKIYQKFQRQCRLRQLKNILPYLYKPGVLKFVFLKFMQQIRNLST